MKKVFLPKKRGVFAISGIIIAIIIVVLAVVLFPILRKQAGFPPSQVAWQGYSSSSLGFSVSIPPEWNVKEERAQSGSDIIISDKKGSSFVRIRGLLDSNLDSADKVSSSIADYKRILTLQEGVVISNFQIGDIKKEVGEFAVSGQFMINDTNYRFEERGQISMARHALIIRAADVPENFDSSWPTLKKIMNSFKLQ